MIDKNDLEPVLAALRDANPIPHVPLASGIQAETLFQEITMSAPSSADLPSARLPSETLSSETAATRDFGPAPSKDEFAPRGSAKKRRFALTGVAAATAAAVGFGAVAIAPGSMPEAQAAMIAAAENTEAARAGTAIVTVTTDDGSGQQAFVLTTAFDGSDLRATISGDEMMSGFGDTPEVRVVDGTIYVSLGTDWFAIDDPKIADLLATSGLPVDVRNSVSNGIVELVKSASNVEEIAVGHFRATVTVEEAQRLAADLPSLALFTDAFGGEELPADVANQPLDIDLILDAAGMIDVVTIDTDAIDPTTGQAMNGSISIDLNDLGTAQTIEAPADAQPMDMGSLLGGN